jgi:hypothetical protein
MEGKANIQIGHVNNLDKQKVSLTYYVGPFDSVKEAQVAKFAMDEVAEEMGAEIQSEAKVIGDELTNKSKVEAMEITEKIKEKSDEQK